MIPSQRLLCFQHTPDYQVEQDIWVVQPDEEYIISAYSQKGINKVTFEDYDDYMQVVENQYYTGNITIYIADGRFKAF